MYGKYECFVMQMLYVYVLCASVSVLNAAFCMTCRLLMLDDDARGGQMEDAYFIAGLVTAMCVSFCLLHPFAVSAVIIYDRSTACRLCRLQSFLPSRYPAFQYEGQIILRLSVNLDAAYMAFVIVFNSSFILYVYSCQRV